MFLRYEVRPVVLDDKHPSTWTEADLQSLCDEPQRELQKLEFKRELQLDSDGQKREAERDALGMADGGGGVIVYGIAEAALPDGGSAASVLHPLRDGSLYDRLNDVLDNRGDPRLRFDLYAANAVNGGLYLVLDISGRRRPHMASDGRYYGRRGTSTRQMTEAEVAEAYRDRIIREQNALEPLFGEGAGNGELPPDVADRVKRGLNSTELALWREDTGEVDPPGWMSVVVYPEPRRQELLDPIRDQRRFETIDIPDRWAADHVPLQFFRLQPTLAGLRSQLPPRDDAAPAFLATMATDGLMQYGTSLEPGLRDDNPARNRIIFTASHPEQAHDYLQAYGVALGELGYDGPVAAQVSFDHTRGVNLAISRAVVTPFLQPIEEPFIHGRLWRFPERAELLDSAGRILKEVMDRVSLAAGLTDGFWFIDDDGHWIDRRD